jgi:hypothetical protein
VVVKIWSPEVVGFRLLVGGFAKVSIFHEVMKHAELHPQNQEVLTKS